MISKSKQKYILTQTKKLNKKINRIYNSYLDKAASLIITYYNNDNNNFNEFFSNTQNLIMEMLEEVYSIVSKDIKIIYKIKRQLPISEIETYSKDGYTLEERLIRWYSKNSKDFIKEKLSAVNKIKQILKTECLYQKQRIMNNKLQGLCEFAIIEESPDCEHGICNEYAGEWPINELIYPPYHPECQCEVIYEISDDIEDIEDLDLEDDIDEE